MAYPLPSEYAELARWFPRVGERAEAIGVTREMVRRWELVGGRANVRAATRDAIRCVAAIAREHNRGRRLLVATTNLDAERPVVWDIGAIATSGVPGSRELIQDILVASASIPGVFPPTKIKVVADGRTFDELHVDGGTSNQVFMFPSNFSARGTNTKLSARDMRRTLYVVRNGKVTPEFDEVRLADRTGKVLSHTFDFFAGSPDPPQIVTMIEAEGGARLYLQMTDANAKEVKLELPVEFAFRKIHEYGGTPNYFWKCTPVR